jgi:hypothetical protein
MHELNRYDLYELAAQTPDLQARFLHAVHGRAPAVLAEDFSGPSGIARAWLAMAPFHRAICTDRDPDPIEHAQQRLAEQLDEDPHSRATWYICDVLEAGGRADVIASLNFAVCELHERSRLLTYLRHSLLRLEADGVFVADVYAGPDALLTGRYAQTIETEQGDVFYEWEQIEADPLTARVRNAMHFRLPDGRELPNAFEYDWRLWSIPELRDALWEAGFARTEAYTRLGDAMDEDGRLLVSPDSVDGQRTDAPDDLGEDEPIVAYVVGRA